MARITYPSQVKGLLRGSRHLLVTGRRAGLLDNLPDGLPEPVVQALRNLVMEHELGPGTAVASTLTGDEPARVTIGPLPSAGSRHNCPARPELLARVVAASGVGLDSRLAILAMVEDEAHVDATLTGIARGLPQLTRKTAVGAEPKVQILVCGPSGPIRLSGPQKDRIGFIRDAAELVDTPPSELQPEAYAARAKSMLEDLPRVSIKEIVGPALVRQKLGGLHAVGKGASKAPRMLIAAYKPARPKGEHVALIGKGITFDTGGLHLKPRGGMEGMKCDMGGSAAVLGAFRTLVSAGVSCPVTLVLCLAENAIGPDSFKPDDILTMHSGKTVEINNTDAEGRLVLADGLSYAATQLGAKVLIDAATLTGAQMIATGSQHAAIVSNDEGLEQHFVASGKASGDLCHPLLFAPELFQAEFKSPIADMRNSVKNRANAQSSCAAQFLWSHIDMHEVRWVHVDLAGPAWQNDRGTGFGVSLIARAVMDLPT